MLNVSIFIFSKLAKCSYDYYIFYFLDVIKTDHSSPVQMALLLHEGLALVGMVHKHVYTVIGVAAEERVPPFLIYPDDGFRNLKRQVL